MAAAVKPVDEMLSQINYLVPTVDLPFDTFVASLEKVDQSLAQSRPKFLELEEEERQRALNVVRGVIQQNADILQACLIAGIKPERIRVMNGKGEKGFHLDPSATAEEVKRFKEKFLPHVREEFVVVGSFSEKEVDPETKKKIDRLQKSVQACMTTLGNWEKLSNSNRYAWCVVS